MKGFELRIIFEKRKNLEIGLIRDAIYYKLIELIRKIENSTLDR